MPELSLPTMFLTSSQKGEDVRTITINLQDGLFMPEAERMYVSVTQASFPYSIVNISDRLYNNAKFTYGPNNYTLPDGSYLSLTELQETVRILTGDNNIVITANTATNQVVITVPPGSNTLTLPDNLANELGFPPNTVIGAGSTVESSEPVIFNDIIASGIIISCEEDLQATSYYNNLPNANILALVPITNTDIPGGMIQYPKEIWTPQIPLVRLKTVRRFNLRFSSARDPLKDLIFLQGDVTVALTFKAVY